MLGSSVTAEWQPTSWQNRPALQQPQYSDQAALEGVVAALSRLPPIVVSWEVETLREQLAGAQRGERFLLQMSLVLQHGLKRPIIRVGRMAEQYAKPRSADRETRDGEQDPCCDPDATHSSAVVLPAPERAQSPG